MTEAPRSYPEHESALLPCPFCGEKRIYLNEPSEGYRHGSINCPACLVVMPGEVRDRNELISCWNAREPVLTGLQEDLILMSFHNEPAPQPLSDAQGSRPRDFLSWAIEMFGPVAKLRSERLLRFVEEAIELAHAEGMEREVFNRVADRVYSRPAGDTPKEIGQAQACLETFAENIGLSSAAEAQREWERVQSIPQEEWTRRHSAKQALGIALPSTHQNTPTTHDQQEK